MTVQSINMYFHQQTQDIKLLTYCWFNVIINLNKLHYILPLFSIEAGFASVIMSMNLNIFFYEI